LRPLRADCSRPRSGRPVVPWRVSARPGSVRPCYRGLPGEAMSHRPGNRVPSGGQEPGVPGGVRQALPGAQPATADGPKRGRRSGPCVSRGGLRRPSRPSIPPRDWCGLREAQARIGRRGSRDTGAFASSDFDARHILTIFPDGETHPVHHWRSSERGSLTSRLTVTRIPSRPSAHGNTATGQGRDLTPSGPVSRRERTAIRGVPETAHFGVTLQDLRKISARRETIGWPASEQAGPVPIRLLTWIR